MTGSNSFDWECGWNVSGSDRNIVQGDQSFVFGDSNQVYGGKNLVIGTGLNNFNASQLDYTILLGKYNDTTDIANNILIVGNGTDANNRSNAMTLSTDGTIVSKNLPAAPSTAGTYTLQCTVDAQGNATYSWV